mmetsp:Transcript_32547/g.109632  ORF Transcript_32547/g.109632 Transcript_32547/m.109632 type:complete len:252 (-) Transcript_32547:1316-2071(-)
MAATMPSAACLSSSAWASAASSVPNAGDVATRAATPRMVSADDRTCCGVAPKWAAARRCAAATSFGAMSTSVRAFSALSKARTCLARSSRSAPKSPRRLARFAQRSQSSAVSASHLAATSASTRSSSLSRPRPARVVLKPLGVPRFRGRFGAAALSSPVDASGSTVASLSNDVGAAAPCAANSSSCCATCCATQCNCSSSVPTGLFEAWRRSRRRFNAWSTKAGRSRNPAPTRERFSQSRQSSGRAARALS